MHGPWGPIKVDLGTVSPSADHLWEHLRDYFQPAENRAPVPAWFDMLESETRAIPRIRRVNFFIVVGLFREGSFP